MAHVAYALQPTRALAVGKAKKAIGTLSVIECTALLHSNGKWLPVVILHKGQEYMICDLGFWGVFGTADEAAIRQMETKL